MRRRLSVFPLSSATLATVLCGVYCSAGRDRAATEEVSRQETGVTSKPSVQAGTLYVGRSPQGVGWVLDLDVARGSGRLFAPSGTIPLCRVTSDSTGRASFNSPELSNGTEYRFAGRVSSAGFDGVLQQVAARSGRVRQSFVTSLKPIRLRNQPRRPTGDVSGIYSNVSHHAQTGDILGNELLLIDGEDEVVVLTIIYAGGPDWPRLAERVELRGDSLWLWTRYPLRGDTMDIGLVKGDTIQFGRDYKMAKRASLGAVFAQPSPYRCP